MKKLFALAFLGLFISLTSCGDKKEKSPEKITIQNGSETDVDAAKTEPSDTAQDPAVIAEGKKLFKDKTCFTCHQPATKGIGPSVKAINKVYAEANASIFKFLKGEGEALVDTDPAQVAIMKANLDGFVKDLTDEEIKAMEAYMLSVQ